MELNSLQDLYIHGLKNLYDAENRIVKTLPKMQEASRSPQLKEAFEQHLMQTRNQVARLETIFNGMGESPKGGKCKGIAGIVDEGEDMVSDTEDSPPAVIDAALIACAQCLEHYEMSAYGTVRTWARRLGRTDDAAMLQETLEEEAQADKKLTSIAESYVNEEAKFAR